MNQHLITETFTFDILSLQTEMQILTFFCFLKSKNSTFLEHTKSMTKPNISLKMHC